MPLPFAWRGPIRRAAAHLMLAGAVAVVLLIVTGAIPPVDIKGGPP